MNIKGSSAATLDAFADREDGLVRGHHAVVDDQSAIGGEARRHAEVAIELDADRLHHQVGRDLASLMARSRKLTVMISSRCKDFIPGPGGRNLSDIRADLKKEIESSSILDRQIFDVWINEERAAGGGAR